MGYTTSVFIWTTFIICLCQKVMFQASYRKHISLSTSADVDLICRTSWFSFSVSCKQIKWFNNSWTLGLHLCTSTFRQQADFRSFLLLISQFFDCAYKDTCYVEDERCIYIPRKMCIGISHKKMSNLHSIPNRYIRP